MTRYRYRTDELLVHADDCDLIRAELAGFGYRQEDRTGPLRRFTGVPARLAVPDVLATLRSRHGARLRVGPNHVFGLDRIIWNMLQPKPTNLRLPDLPAVGITVDVGVVDTGIVLRRGKPHPYLQGRVDFGPEDVDPIVRDLDGNPTGSDGHGSFVAGVLLAQTQGNVRVRMKGVLDKSTGDVEDLAVAAAIDELREAGVKLINLSFSGATWEDQPPKAIENALRRLDAGTVVVAAAGNHGLRQRVYPAAISLGGTIAGEPAPGNARVIAVGAVNEHETGPDGDKPVADFSNYGAWVRAYANGVDVVGPYFEPGYPVSPEDRGDSPYHGWAIWSGTSFAAATVTGQIAARMAASPDLSAAGAAHDLLANAEPVPYWDVSGKDFRPLIPGALPTI
jgi:hypothetical protein